MINGPREALLSPQLLESGGLVKDSVRGIFQTREELDDYERLWHCHVYQPTRDKLQDKVRNNRSRVSGRELLVVSCACVH